jgi:hypothetical protein
MQPAPATDTQLRGRVETELEGLFVVRHAPVEHQLEDGEIRVLMFAVAAKHVSIGADAIAKLPVNVVLRSMMLDLENVDVQSPTGIEGLMVLQPFEYVIGMSIPG